MRWHTVGHAALGPHVTALDILAARGFNLSKKVFVDQGPAASTYYQAETDAEDRELRLKFPGVGHFHLAQQKAVAGGGYR